MQTLIMLLIFFVGTSANAKVFVEPYVGLVKLQVKVQSTGYYDISDGFFLGAKAGFALNQKIHIGADYQTGGPYKWGPLLADSEWNHKMFGFGLGMDYRVVRFWAGYYIDQTFEDRVAGTFTGTAYKLGFGISMSSKIRCNLELITYNIDKVEFEGYSAPFSGYSISSANVSISIPLAL